MAQNALAGNNPLEVDDALADTDSAYNESMGVDTMRFMKDHMLWFAARAKTYSKHPSAQVIGTDLSPIQSPWVPPNCVFEIDDFHTDWVYKNKFDFIMAAFEHLKSGGYFEFDGAYAHFLSDDDTHKKAENCQSWLEKLRDASAKFGKSIENVRYWKEKMEKAGFVDVKEESFKVPIGPWPKDPKLKEIGRFQQVQQIQGAEVYTPALFSRVLGWSKEEIDVLLAKVRDEIKDR
ncbi:UMTA methyltransferase family protein [Rasamsonia emersonii CBS 393.64]|uniref:UMTA methyltransferase family protein n=1 Tax=Rasamsonia emersonii (strain ATCC 16479 / CBS 393.64 / IMI 116815) TaxID=1408163 RepID=A0A0F4YEN5_RASE3|nr:UMTA methyltransferase family protein [Rasamsonia emersonii CBS 393.64]KKA16637.1 UMTA methyltransferase family protein [Rasamsonia emersonii CBS 393.64]